MDSGNSGSISPSGDEEYDSRVDHTTLLPSTFLNHPPTQFGQSSSLNVSSHHHSPSLFDLSSSYLHSLPNTNPNSSLNLDTTTTSTYQGKRSEPNCTDPASLQGFNQGLFPPPHGLGHDDNKNARAVSSAPTNNAAAAARNSKKRTRASRRAPTTVLATDTSNFRAMVQEFTGIPAPPFSGSSSYSLTRRLDLLSGSSSSLRTSASHHLDTTPSFYPLRPSPQKLHHRQNPFPSTLLTNNNMVDAIASSTTNNNNTINYQLPPDLGLPYHHHSQNIMLSMQQNHPNILAFHQTPSLHSLGNHVLSGFGAKSLGSLSVQSLEELGMNHGQVNNADLVGASDVSVPQGHDRVTSDHGNGDRRELNFSKASVSSSLNHENNLENNSTGTTRGEGNVDSWICSSD